MYNKDPAALNGNSSKSGSASTFPNINNKLIGYSNYCTKPTK